MGMKIAKKFKVVKTKIEVRIPANIAITISLLFIYSPTLGRLERFELSLAGPQPDVLPLHHNLHWRVRTELNCDPEIKRLLL